MARKTKAQLAAIEEAKADLLKVLKPGDTVHLILRHVSKSGMRRDIAPVLMRNGEPWYLTHNAAIVLDSKVGKHDGVVMDGCGMDMGFALVYHLSSVLFRGMDR